MYLKARPRPLSESRKGTQICQFELFELVDGSKFLNMLFLLSELDKQFPVEQFETPVSQPTVRSPPS